MKLSSKGRYAVMAMADLAKNDDSKPISLKEISLRQGISISFLEELKPSKVRFPLKPESIFPKLHIIPFLAQLVRNHN